MKITNLPQEFLKQAKELGVELVKPASKEGIRKIALGAGSAALISPLYSKGFDWLWTKVPTDNLIIKTVAKVGIPLAISAIALKTKFPGGNILCGGMVGVGLLELGKSLFEGLKGKFSTSKTPLTNGKIPDEDIEFYTG